MSRRLRVVLAGVGVTVVVLSVGGLLLARALPRTKDVPALNLPPLASGSPTAGPMYSVDGLDVCAKADLSALAAFTLVSRTPGPAGAPPTERSCEFALRTADGHEASLFVDARTWATVPAAASSYEAARAVTGLDSEGDLPGVGEQAFGRSMSGEDGAKGAFGLAQNQVRAGNLVVNVQLTVNGATATPYATIAPKVLSIVRGVLAVVPKVSF